MSLLSNIFGKSDVKNGVESILTETMSLPDFNTVFSFGSHSDRNYGELIFLPNGNLYGYSNINERAWKSEGNEICLVNEEGHVTSRFKSTSNNNWIGHGEGNKWPLYLLPILTLEKARSIFSEDISGFLVNSIPKSGTYFLEAALSSLGSKSLRLHLSGLDIVDDYRLLQDNEIHVNPTKHRIKLSLHLITFLLQGRTVVGHIDSSDIISSIQAQGVCIFNVRRNLRDVLVSLFRFKYNKVAAAGQSDIYWREMSKDSRFVNFLITYSQYDISHIKTTAEMMINDHSSIELSYEDMCKGHLPDKAVISLDGYCDGFSALLRNSLAEQYGKSNPTYSGKRSNWQEYWSEDAEVFFKLSGLYDINVKLGYS